MTVGIAVLTTVASSAARKMPSKRPAVTNQRRRFVSPTLGWVASSEDIRRFYKAITIPADIGRLRAFFSV